MNSTICPHCGKTKGRGGHPACSKAMQAERLARKGPSESTRLAEGRRNAAKYAAGKIYVPA